MITKQSNVKVYFCTPSYTGRNEIVSVLVKDIPIHVLRAVKEDGTILWRLKEPKANTQNFVNKSLAKAYLQYRIPELEKAYQEYKNKKKHKH